MDNADRAQSEIDLELSIALKNRSKAPEQPETGLCHWCDLIIGVGKFCSTDCRDDFEKQQKIKGLS